MAYVIEQRTVITSGPTSQLVTENRVYIIQKIPYLMSFSSTVSVGFVSKKHQKPSKICTVANLACRVFCLALEIFFFSNWAQIRCSNSKFLFARIEFSPVEKTYSLANQAVWTQTYRFPVPVSSALLSATVYLMRLTGFLFPASPQHQLVAIAQCENKCISLPACLPPQTQDSIHGHGGVF